MLVLATDNDNRRYEGFPCQARTCHPLSRPLTVYLSSFIINFNCLFSPLCLHTKHAWRTSFRELVAFTHLLYLGARANVRCRPGCV